MLSVASLLFGEFSRISRLGLLRPPLALEVVLGRSIDATGFARWRIQEWMNFNPGLFNMPSERTMER